MTIPRLRALSQYWLSKPPTHILLAGVYRYRANEHAKEEAQRQGLAEAMNFFNKK